MRGVQGALLALLTPIAGLLLHAALGQPLEAELEGYLYLYCQLLIGPLLMLAAFGAILGRREDRLLAEKAALDRLAVTDPATGLKNARYFRARLQEAYAKSSRDRTPLGIAVIDLDHFKQINDQHGHPIGDRVLAVIGHAIGAVVRRGETAARVGGDEFALILPGSDLEAAEVAAERVRRAVATAALEPGLPVLALSASVGVASTSAFDGRGAEALYTAADAALLAAKRQGRRGRDPEPVEPRAAVHGAAA